MRLTHRFVGGYRLEMDQTWTPLDRIAVVDENKQMTRKLLMNTPELSETLSRQIGGAELMESTQIENQLVETDCRQFGFIVISVDFYFD